MGQIYLKKLNCADIALLLASTDVASNVCTSLSPWGRVGVGLKSTEEIKKISGVTDVKKPFF
jgi:hypothetical protein